VLYGVEIGQSGMFADRGTDQAARLLMEASAREAATITFS